MPSNVVPRHNGYGARVTVGGTQHWLGTFPTRSEAEEAVQRARRGVMPSQTTLAEWAAVWQTFMPGVRSRETERHNNAMVAGFIRAYGHRRLESLTGPEVAFYAQSRPGSARYLRSLLGTARSCGFVVTSAGNVPQIGRSRRVQVVPDARMVESLAAAARARGWPGFGDCVVFTAYSGLRLSEVADLHAADVYLGARRVDVRGKRHAGDPGPRERVAVVLEPGRAALQRQVPEVGLVFRSPQGRRLTRESVSRCFRAVAGDCGFAGTFHSLRRFYATLLRDLGADPRDIAASLGHVDEAGRPYPELVDRVYSQPSLDAALGRLEAVAG